MNLNKYWTVDLGACEVHHESGLIVRFTKDATGWNGTSPNAQTWFKENPVERAKIVAGLMREASEVYQQALDESIKSA